MTTITADMIINDVVNRHPATMKVFNDFKLDSCCGGAQSIKAAAMVANADLAKVVEALNKAAAKGK